MQRAQITSVGPNSTNAVSKKRLETKFYVYEEHDCFCPFCSDDTVDLKFQTKHDRVGGYIKITYRCCNLILEHKVPNELFQKYLDNWYLGFLSGYHKHELQDLIQKEIFIARDKVINMLKKLMPLQDIYPQLIGSF